MHAYALRLAILLVASSTFLPAQAEESTQVPQEFQGTWGSDCARPQMRFDAMVIHDLRNQARGPVLKVVRNGDQLEIRYSLKVAGQFQDIADTFQVEGPTLRLVKSVYGQQEMEWKKNPWKKCT
jgi:hypothetical protein